ncbi:hypothetical protein M406DRAFT_60366 [Cryphonectria parasitica EP155]|uniref:Glutathione S-transferase n=1 Tax=Cryphonectria parasitica (strain ATCC 38755 / EP155) TaxID=660469 RepID=A0A9P4Y3B1_CRYP1|nr:uncharacterized protein M406DRAFT_60366 [Cryphonectria parasitica EP155]KAF3765761.1 hypothetical protein M406DRAFT_60366 [Cryphonectria parasitica EP155]
MSLEVHHLHLSQSERIVWLLEELNIPYELHVHERDPQSALAPADLKALNPFGTAPYFRDTKVSPPVELSESGAIVEYILTVYGGSGAVRLTRTPDDKEYGAYLQWLHYANGSLQPTMSRNMTFLLAGIGSGNPIIESFKARTDTALRLLDDRLAVSKYLADEELSTADIMSLFSLTTTRGFCPRDLSPYPNILRYLKDIAARPGYQEAIRKGDHGMEPMIAAQALSREK